MTVSDCWAVNNYGDHVYIVIYVRPWYRLFRKTKVIVCTRCELFLMQP